MRRPVRPWQGVPPPARLADVRAVRCPTCRHEAPWEGNPHRPFCSERCRLLDLAAWADGRYRIPGEPVPTESDEPGADGSGPDGRAR